MLAIITAIQVSSLTSDYAHDPSAHTLPAKEWQITGQPSVAADFIKLEDDIVYLTDSHHQLLSFNLSEFLANDQTYILEKTPIFKNVSTHHDDKYLYVESNGIPSHEMMTGITSWQQQVPIDQDYTNENSWVIPLQPELADEPLMAKDNFMKGAIAIAANGIPIFNPLNNRGEDTEAFGELDNLDALMITTIILHQPIYSHKLVKISPLLMR